MYQALKAQFEASRLKALANIKILVSTPVGVAEHADTIGTLASEAKNLAEADDVLLCLQKYFEQSEENKETEVQ